MFIVAKILQITFGPLDWEPKQPGLVYYNIYGAYFELDHMS